ncbi:FAD-dependent oxidoreductase [Pedobacter sandarakinus]|uniref:FAD-dependent oxidoreductase n=1 Tax=Pedobacter sandarakinus TaxID=353156 RepID=UPI002246DBA6|nr:FAD-dependent oxidoreductase [Pedobacter sandarakinus]MCX2575481.1 FAD-dependent oxidoreductase [Pedobacter sandarakinus]
MSGQTFYKDQVNSFLKRRAFLLRLGLVTGGIFLNGCYQKAKKNAYNISGNLIGPNAKAGHILRDKTKLPQPGAVKKVKTLIVGGGISGLSAGRWLKQNGETDFEIIDLENYVGGNSHFGQNEVTAHPLGAHYITVANNDDTLLLDFLHEINVITHYENKLPFYNEYFLTFDPEERLLINGEWQEGLVPDFGVPPADKKQIKAFFAEVEKLKNTKGSDGKFLFQIPVKESSTDESIRKLDQISFDQYLKAKGFNSKYLLWYLNYACKDDYGQKATKISAWAGLHYFASRRGTSANAEQNAIITWPQGNGWLVQQMQQKLKNHIKTSQMCCELEIKSNGKVHALIYDVQAHNTQCIVADHVILATPQFVNNRLLKDIERPIDYQQFSYSPWLVANITLDQLPSAKGTNLCWDNVVYNTPSVGYVNATQQQLQLAEDRKVFTYYLPLCDHEPAISRLAAYSRSYEQWLAIVMPELELMHPGISNSIENIDFWIWGHGMIAPTKNFIWSKNLQQARKSMADKIFFAHTDLSGISIFEEAFHQGINAAKQVLNAKS